MVCWALLGLPAFDLLTKGRDAALDLNARFMPYERWQDTSADSLVFVSIDDESIKAVGQWPWDRSVMAKLVGHLQESGVAAVGIDILFLEPDQRSAPALCKRFNLTQAFCGDPRFDGDKRLGDKVSQTPTAVSFAFGHETINRQTSQIRTSVIPANGADRLIPTAASFHAPIEALTQAQGLGFVNAYVEDGIVRRVPLFLKHDSTTFPALSIEMLRLASKSSQLTLRSSVGGDRLLADFGTAQLFVGPADGFMIHHGHTTRFEKIPALRLLEHPMETFRGKIAIIGLDAIAIGDRHSTPLEEGIAGPLLQLHVVDQLLSGRVLQINEGLDRLIFACSAAVALLLVVFAEAVPARTLLVAAGAGSGLVTIGALVAFHTDGLVLSYPVHLSLWVIGGTTAYFFKAFREEQLRRRVQGSFAQYISPEVVKRITQSKHMPQLGGEKIFATIMFIDIRGFTGLTERLKDDPELLVHVISEIMSDITAHLIQRSATIDKYIGDCVMAFWNAPERQSDHVLLAMQSAIALVRDAQRIADKITKMDARLANTPIQFGIGLCSGEVIVGNLGSHLRFNYSVLGDAVNLASRLESLTKDMGVPILASGLTEESRRGLMASQIEMIHMGSTEIRGRREPVEIFSPQIAKSSEAVNQMPLN